MGVLNRPGKTLDPGDKKFSGQEILRDLIPLNALTEERFREVAGKLAIEDVNAGSYLFSEGDRDNRSIYLLDGVINFIDRTGQVTGVISAGTDPARYPIANKQPRIITARAATKAVIASLNSNLLDVLLTLDQTAGSGSLNLGNAPEDGWMKRMLQSDAFSRLPPSEVQRLVKCLEVVRVKAGDIIVRQGDNGDYFYIIREGTCSVTRLASGEGWDVPLAELEPGDSFGEDALASDGKRNATVTMLTNGSLMRLSKQHFVEILKRPLVQSVDYDTAMAAIAHGDRWLDVRLTEEHENHALPNSINLPLASLRDSVIRLDSNRHYIVYCDTGRRSAAAAFLLSQRGLHARVLAGGLNGLPGSDNSTQSVTGGRTVARPAVTSNPNARPAAAPAPASSPTGSNFAQEKLNALRAELSELRNHINAYNSATTRLDKAREEERVARDRLNHKLQRLLDKLG